GRRNAHQPRVEPVLHISLENAVLDEDIFLRWRTLVVDAERAAAPAPDGACKAPVVDHGDAWCCDALADPPGKGARTLAIEIALQPVTDRLMQQHAGPAGAEQHG